MAANSSRVAVADSIGLGVQAENIDAIPWTAILKRLGRTVGSEMPIFCHNLRRKRWQPAQKPLLTERPRVHSRRSGLQPAGLSSRVAHPCLHRERTRNLRTVCHNFWYVPNSRADRSFCCRIRITYGQRIYQRDCAAKKPCPPATRLDQPLNPRAISHDFLYLILWLRLSRPVIL